MPDLNWERFQQLPGPSTDNWESLCRSIVLRSFGSLGNFRAVAMQPGVEFHLRVDRSSKLLGEPGRWWGWQCRWYDLPAGRKIGTTRRARIEDAIRKTEEHVPEVTDWVLWTRRSLTPSDQKWFYAIESSLQLHLWTENHVDSLLQGDAAVLRRTYFGDLVLTADILRELRCRTLAPVRDRWNPAVHIEVDAEHEIRRFLGEARSWPEIGELQDKLTASKEELTEFADLIDENLDTDLLSLIEDLKDLHNTFTAIDLALTHLNLTQVRELSSSEWSPRITRSAGRLFARTLRRAQHPSSFAVQAAISRQHDALNSLSMISPYLSSNLIVLIGPAGSGKTHLAAELTARKGVRPDGLYLGAWPMKRRGTIDDLLPRLRGLSVSSFEEVLEAVESVGERSGLRIPIVIDGLTESEDPATWRVEVETLRVMLTRFQHVLVMVTLRPSAVDVALPDTLPRIELHGFSSLTHEAISRYFEYYKIDVGGLRLPVERFSDPLFLRIFCEATNSDRVAPVGPEKVPASLVEAFLEFRRVVVQRIANRPGASVRRYAPDILRALDVIALSIWDTGRRGIPFSEVREIIGDTSADWTESLAQALVDEGILSRDPYDDQRTVILFDAFAGFLIADALARQKGREDFAVWLAAKPTMTKLSGESWHPYSTNALSGRWPRNPILAWLWSLTRGILRMLPFSRSEADPSRVLERRAGHPLASDVRKALVGLVPRHFRMQFWQLVDGDLQVEALIDSAELEAELLDETTLKEIARVAIRPRIRGIRDLFDRFLETMDAKRHPLNARILGWAPLPTICQGRSNLRTRGGAKVYHSGLDVQRKCPPATGVVRSP